MRYVVKLVDSEGHIALASTLEGLESLTLGIPEVPDVQYPITHVIVEALAGRDLDAAMLGQATFGDDVKEPRP